MGKTGQPDWYYQSSDSYPPDYYCSVCVCVLLFRDTSGIISTASEIGKKGVGLPPTDPLKTGPVPGLGSRHS